MQTARSPVLAPTEAGFLQKSFRLRVRGRGRTSGTQSWSAGLYEGDRVLTRNEEPPLGAHLVTPRFAYTHHGVYVGGGAVIHYSAFAYHWPRGPVEQIPLKLFAHGHSVWVRPAGPTGLPREEIVRRAWSRLGENRYRFFSNNCEHLSEWCVNGKANSRQAERIFARVRSVSTVFSAFVRLLKATPLRSGDCPGTRTT